MSPQFIDKMAIARSFGQAAQSYDAAAHFQRWAGNTLLEKLGDGTYRKVLDLGTGTGYFLPALEGRFRAEHLVGLDLSEGMLRFARTNHKDQMGLLAGDAENLPLKDASFDLVFSSLAIQWCENLPKLFQEVRRVLKPGGVFAFSTLLDGSLYELKTAWSEVDSAQHVNEFFDIKYYRESARKAGFDDCAMEQIAHSLRYTSALALAKELKDLGAHNVTDKRPKALTGRARLKAFVAAYEQFRDQSGSLPATYQVGLGLLQK